MPLGRSRNFFVLVAGCRGCGYCCFNFDAASAVHYFQLDDHRRGGGSVGSNVTVTKKS